MTTKNQSTALVTDPKQAYGELQEYLLAKSAAIRNVAPKYMDTERMIRLALGASSRAPRLLQCSPKSWLMALMDCAYYGIEPNPALGHAYLVPYQNRKLAGQPFEVTFQIGYKGLVLLACESGGFDDVEARIVYAGELAADHFQETPEDPARPFRHRPLYTAEQRGDIAGAYAVGWRGVDKRPRFQYLTIEEIEGYRGRSRAAKEGPWITDYEAMAKKTAIRRMLAYAAIRSGSKLGAVLEQESALDRDEVIRAQDWQVGDPTGRIGSRTDDLADKLAKKAGTAPVERVELDDQQDMFEP